SIEKILCEARGSGPAEFATILLPNCSVRSRTGQHLAKAMLQNEQLIETCWYGIVREVIPVAEFRVRCFQPLSHLSGVGLSSTYKTMAKKKPVSSAQVRTKAFCPASIPSGVAIARKVPPAGLTHPRRERRSARVSVLSLARRSLNLAGRNNTC